MKLCAHCKAEIPATSARCLVCGDHDRGALNEGYECLDPKSDGYHGRMADAWDTRDEK